ncbi:hypothetical protein DSECCO2_621600 [anaerobic digester metagenome]
MLAQVVGAKGGVDLAKKRGYGGLAPGPGRAGLAVGHDAVGLDEPRAKRRGQPEDDRGGVAAGVGHEPGLLDGRAVELRQAVDGLGQKVGVAVVQAVPGGVDVLVRQAEVGGKVHDLEPGGEQFGGVIHGRAVGHGEKDQLAGRGQIGGVGLGHAHVAGHEALQEGIDGGQRLARLGAGGGAHEPQHGVHGQDAGQFHAGIARDADEADGNGFHGGLRGYCFLT